MESQVLKNQIVLIHGLLLWYAYSFGKGLLAQTGNSTVFKST